MRTLETQDIFWIKKRMPESVRSLMMKNARVLFLAGGFIRACIANEQASDIDLFTSSKDLAREIGMYLVAHGKGLRMVETDNAFTVLGLSVPVQLIHRWTFDAPQKCVESFDFTIARAAIWFDAEERDGSRHSVLQSCCDDRFYSDLAAKRLVYCSPVRNEDAGGSMLRVLKFYQRGYRIPLDSLGAVMARMANAVDRGAIDASMKANNCSYEEQVARVFTGMLHEVDPNIDPEHLSHLPSIASPA